MKSAISKLAPMPHGRKMDCRESEVMSSVMVLTPAVIDEWESPPFQRPLMVNEQVRLLAEKLKDTEELPGTLHLGVINGKTYRVDGQHRCESFKLSGLKEVLAVVVTRTFATMADMGRYYVDLQRQLSKLRPDDVLRGLEGSSPALGNIRSRCPFVGYDHIRRGESSPMLSMSVALRSWFGSAPEVPCHSTAAAAILGMEMTLADASQCAEFLTLAYDAWGRDVEYQRAWGALNLTLCMWFYRRIVLDKYSVRSDRATKEQFRAMLMALTQDALYVEWIRGRLLNDVHRGPTYNKIKSIFARRLQEDLGRKVKLPQPPWA